MGNFGGHAGRVLRAGDMIKMVNPTYSIDWKLQRATPTFRAAERIPSYGKEWKIGVLYGPHGAPDFLNLNILKNFLLQHGMCTLTQTDWVFA